MSRTPWILTVACALLLALPAAAQPPPPPPDAPEDALQFDPDLPPDAPPADAPQPPPPGHRGPPPPHPHAAPHPPEPPAPLDDKQEQEALEFLRRESPELIPYLQKLQKERPREYRAHLRRAWGDRRHLERVQRDDPERFEAVRREQALERQSRLLVQRHREATLAPERQQLRAELEAVLAELFDLREQHREARIAQLEREIEKLRETTQKRQENKPLIVQRRLEELLGHDAELRW